jgi:hypothetical protein
VANKNWLCPDKKTRLSDCLTGNARLNSTANRPCIEANPFGAQQTNLFDLRVVRVDQAIAFRPVFSKPAFPVHLE